MNAFVYHWSLRVTPEIRIDLQIGSESAAAARREVERFLRRHDAASWQLEAVSRQPSGALDGPESLDLPQPDRGAGEGAGAPR